MNKSSSRRRHDVHSSSLLDGRKKQQIMQHYDLIPLFHLILNSSFAISRFALGCSAFE